MTPKSQATIEKLDFINILKLGASKDTVIRVQRQLIGWEKISIIIYLARN